MQESLDHFEIGEIEVFVDISPSNSKMYHTHGGNMAASGSYSRDWWRTSYA